MGLVWDGITTAASIEPEWAAARRVLANAAKRGAWDIVLGVIRNDGNLVNATRLHGTSLFTPLHHAAHNAAPVAVIEELIALGAWRSLRNSDGEQAVDVAERRGHVQLRDMLKPVFFRTAPAEVMARIESNFHDVIRGRAGDLVTGARLRLPLLEPLLERAEDSDPVWFAVPGMMGGFGYCLLLEGAEPTLVSESWSRVVEGSEETHEITATGSRLVPRRRRSLWR